MKCNKCGNIIKKDSTFCTRCGTKIEFDGENTTSFEYELDAKKKRKIFLNSIIVVFFIVYFFLLSCDSTFCPLPKTFRSDYCFIHTCERSNCLNKKVKGKSYCYTHSPSKSSNITYTPEVAEDVLKFSDLQVTHNRLFTVCSGSLKNTGKKTYTFVEVKGKFKNSSGTVIDSDWTYAVGSEGLEPGESVTFEVSVDKNWDIERCSMEIIDYQKK